MNFQTKYIQINLLNGKTDQIYLVMDVFQFLFSLYVKMEI